MRSALLCSLAFASIAQAQVGYYYPQSFARPYNPYPAYYHPAYSATYAYYPAVYRNPYVQQQPIYYHPAVRGYPQTTPAVRSSAPDVIPSEPMPGPPINFEAMPRGEAVGEGEAIPYPTYRGAAVVVPAEAPPAPVEYHRVPSDSFWISGGYINSWLRRGKLAAPLVTIGSALDARPGAVGQPGTSILFDDRDLNAFSGVRLEMGAFLDCDNRFSVELGGFWLLQQRESSTVASDAGGNPVFARPIQNADTGVEGAFLTSFPGLFSGATTVEVQTELWGLELNGRCHSYLHRRWHADGLLGFRYLHLRESLAVRDNLTPLAAGVLTFNGNPLGVTDRLADEDLFRTTNTFYGLQIGGQVRWEHDFFTVGAFGKLGLGATDQRVRINGTTYLTTPAGVQTANGGVLALPTNIGDHNRSTFSLVPEFGLNFSVALSRSLHLTGGYSILLWTNVARPGDQLDHVVSPGLAPSDPTFGNAANPTRPFFTFRDELFWVHTLSLGLEYRY